MKKLTYATREILDICEHCGYDCSDYVPYDEQTEEIQKMAIEEDIHNFPMLNNPPESLCIDGIETDPLLIYFISNPTEEMRISASVIGGMDEFDYEFLAKRNFKDILDRYPELIRYMKNPSETLCMELIEANLSNIQYIENPSENVCMEVVKKEPEHIQYIENPSENVCMEVVSRCPYCIQYIKNPSPNVCLEAVKQNPYILCYINEPTEEIYLKLMEYDINFFYNIKYPTEFLCLKAIELDPTLIRDISIKYPNLCKNAIDQARVQGYDILEFIKTYIL